MTGKIERACREKLRRLLPRLASDSDGEVIATVRGLDRMLRSNGLDWHDLAAAICSTDAAPASSDIAGPMSQAMDWRSLAYWCRDVAGRHLAAKEQSFVLSMCRNIDRGRQPSPKQGEWLRDIYARYARAA